MDAQPGRDLSDFRRPALRRLFFRDFRVITFFPVR
jgi:hypothetical protein